MKTFPPAPPEFKQEFEAGGWQRVEHLYGARTDCIKKWIAVTGAQCRFPKGGRINDNQ